MGNETFTLSDLKKDMENSDSFSLSDIVPQTRTFLDEVGRQIGLTGRAAIQGVTAIPNMFGNAAAGIYNASFLPDPKVRLPTSTQSLDQLLTNARIPLTDIHPFPQPETKTERVAQDVSTALASA